jgi:HEAT repeat protein
MRLAIPAVVAVGLLVTAPGVAAQPDPRSPKDPFGRPQPHGEPVKGAFVGLSTGRTNLFFGQPLLVELFAVAGSAGKGPYVHPRLGSNVLLDLTDGEGRPVPYRLESLGSSEGGGHANFPFELWPTPTHAVGVYWKPGTYRLRAVVEKKLDPTLPHSLPGTFRSNTLTFTVAKPGTPLDRCEPDGATRERVAKLIAALDAPAVADRDAAEKSLAAEADPAVLLWLDTMLAGATPEARRRLLAVRKAHDERLRLAVTGPTAFQGTDFWLWAGGLDGEVSERLRQRGGWDEAGWRTSTARFGPVIFPQDRPPNPDEAARLAAQLRHADPWVRMLAVRSVPKGSPVEVRTALAERLDDRYEERPWRVHPWQSAPFTPINYEAKQSAVRIGLEMVESLVAFASRYDNAQHRGVVAETLGRIGPDAKAREFLRRLIRGGRHEDQYAAQTAVVAWGKGGVDLLREVLGVPGLPTINRGVAIEGLGQHGDRATDGPTIHKLLAETDRYIQGAAVKAVGSLRYREALPDLERIARDPKIDQNIRYVAVDGVLAMTDETAGNQLLLDLLDTKHGKAVRTFVFTRIGQRKVMVALPDLLDALSDSEWIVRTYADAGLRGLAGRWEGVGYDPHNPEPKKWREYWENKK